MNNFRTTDKESADALHEDRPVTRFHLSQIFVTAQGTRNKTSQANISAIQTLARKNLDENRKFSTLSALSPEQKYSNCFAPNISGMPSGPVLQDREATWVKDAEDRRTWVGKSARAWYYDSRHCENAYNNGAESPIDAHVGSGTSFPPVIDCLGAIDVDLIASISGR